MPPFWSNFQKKHSRPFIIFWGYSFIPAQMGSINSACNRNLRWSSRMWLLVGFTRILFTSFSVAASGPFHAALLIDHLRTKCTYFQYGYAIHLVTAFGLGLISSMRLDERKDVQSVKSPGSILHSELKACVLLPLEGNNKGSFFWYFILLSQARKSSFQMWSNLLLKNIYMYSFDLLN